MMIKIWATPELHTLGIRMYQSKQDCISQKQPFPCIVLLKSRIFFMQQDIHRLGILQGSSCRRYRDRVKYKLARIPRVPGIPTRIPKVNTASLKTRVFWHLLFFKKIGCSARQTKGMLDMLEPSVFTIYMSKLWFP